MKELGQFEAYLVHEFVEDYVDGLMSRRDLVRRVLPITGGVAATATLLSSLGVAPLTGSVAAQASPPPTADGPRSPLSVPASDPRIQGEDITFPGNGATLMAYQARPAAGGGTPVAGSALPLVLVCHENKGLTEHIRDVARRWSVRGYVACAVDLLSREGGTSNVADPAQIPAILTKSDASRHVADFQAALDHYQNQPFVDASRAGMNGFCFGGGITWLAATAIAGLRVAAPFYGPPPPLDAVPKIKAAVLGIYSDDPNDFANKGRDQFKAALDAANITYQFKVYPGTQHAFHNDTGPRWNEQQALAAWTDAGAWFERYLKG